MKRVSASWRRLRRRSHDGALHHLKLPVKRMAAEIGAGDAGGQAQADFRLFGFLGSRLPERRFQHGPILSPKFEFISEAQRVDHAEEDPGAGDFRIEAANTPCWEMRS